jgi:hypothetical protein
LRVIEYRDSGHTFKEVYEAFGMDPKRCYCWKKQLDETGSVKFHAPTATLINLPPISVAVETSFLLYLLITLRKYHI